MFGFKKNNTNDKYFEALSQAQGEWKIQHGYFKTIVTLASKDETFEFISENLLYKTKYFEKIQDFKRVIDKTLFKKIHKLAQEHISQHQIQKAGGYILDDDLKKAISDTKKILGARSQIEVLHSQIMGIRKKYK